MMVLLDNNNLFNNLITVFVLLTLALIVYLRVTKKTLVDFYREIREIASDTQEEPIPMGGLQG